MNVNCDIDKILGELHEHGFGEGDIVRLFGHEEDEQRALLIAENARLQAQFFHEPALKEGTVVIVNGEDPIGKIDTELLEKELQEKAVAPLGLLAEKDEELYKNVYADCSSGQERRRARRALERKQKKNRR